MEVEVRTGWPLSGKPGKVREIGLVREKSGNFVKGQGKNTRSRIKKSGKLGME